jgi:phytanoyl-CoA dioxygenase PhyH
MNMLANLTERLRRGSLSNFIRRQSDWFFNIPRYSWPIWFNVVNRRARAHYLSNAPQLTPLQSRAVEELRQKGICVLDCDQVFSAQSSATYRTLGERVVEETHNKNRIAALRREINAPIARNRQKYYYLSLWEDGVMDFSNPFVQFSLSDEILGIVNGYLEMSARLVNVDLWYHLPMEGANIASQNWHRDPTDKKFLKVFFYLRDVDEMSGPFEFVVGSHEMGPYGKTFPRKLPHGIYPPPGAVERHFTDAQRKKYTGKAGTIVICDTSGLHRGGHVLSNDRFLFYTYYLTDGAYDLSKFVERYGYTLKGEDNTFLSPAAEFAIEMWRKHSMHGAAGASASSAPKGE